MTKPYYTNSFNGRRPSKGRQKARVQILQMKMTSNGRRRQNIKCGISQEPLIGSYSNFKLGISQQPLMSS